MLYTGIRTYHLASKVSISSSQHHKLSRQSLLLDLQLTAVFTGRFTLLILCILALIDRRYTFTLIVRLVTMSHRRTFIVLVILITMGLIVRRCALAIGITAPAPASVETLVRLDRVGTLVVAPISTVAVPCSSRQSECWRGGGIGRSTHRACER